MKAAARIDVELIALDGMGMLRSEWQPLERACKPPPYLTYDWLEDWAFVYSPSKLRLIRIASGSRGVIALGLLEELAGHRLRFAGGTVTSLRGLLCATEDEAIAWQGLGRWLAGHRRAWRYLEADGVPTAARALPGAVATPAPWFSFPLPDSFEDYLKERPSGVRKRFLRKLRAAERAGVVAERVSPEGVGGAIGEFVRLHNARARTKAELHGNIDERLGRLLTRLADRIRPDLSVIVLRRDGDTLAVTIRVDHFGRSWFYNAGFDPAAAQLSPGIVVELASIRDAIERGNGIYELGPGDYRYKRELGGQPRGSLRIRATSGSLAGHISQLAIRAADRARSTEWLKAGRHAWRTRRQRLPSAGDREARPS